MNLLVVSPFFPECSSGACTRTYHIIRALTREHNVSLLVLTNTSHKRPEAHPPQGLKLQRYAEVALGQVSRPKKRLKQIFGILRGRSPLLESYRLKEIQEKLDALFAERHYDIIIFDGSLIAAEYRLPRPTRVIIHEHNIEYELDGIIAGKVAKCSLPS
jgi:hypothetical protein